MTSLADKLIELTLDVDDRKKTIGLLQKFIQDQKQRHASEASNFEKETYSLLEKTNAERDNALRELSKANELLSQKKTSLDECVELLVVEKENVEHHKTLSIEQVRRVTEETKERAYSEHHQQKLDREKAWLDTRVSEIQKMTLRGIQPNVDRLIRKHNEECDEIKCKTQASKRKLELQCETELIERIDEFQRIEQQSFTSIAQKNEFSHLLIREQSEHASKIEKLKVAFNEKYEIENKLHAVELQTLMKENYVTICKEKSCSSTQQLRQNLQNKQEIRRHELDMQLEQISRNFASSKRDLEDLLTERSRTREGVLNKQKMAELLQWREVEMKHLIRCNILELAELDTNNDTSIETESTVLHTSKLSEWHGNVASQNCSNEDVRKKISSTTKFRMDQQSLLDQLQKDFIEACKKLHESVTIKERELKYRDEVLAETCHQYERSLYSLRRHQNELQGEVARMKESINEDLRIHNVNKSELLRAHEQRLETLQHHTAEAVCELDKELLSIRNAVVKKKVLLSKAHDLFCAKYDTKLTRIGDTL